MMDKLNIKVQYSALYRPESIGLLERQHRSLKDSLKAALVDMGEVHQDKWLDFLPFVLLGKRVTVQEDIGVSPCELAYGTTVKIPGQILRNPGDYESPSELHQLVEQVRNGTNVSAHQTSVHRTPEKEFLDIPDNVTHVFTRQHKTQGLQCPYEGPFKVHSRVSRSTLQLEVGKFKNGEPRFEIRHINDLKFAHPESMAAPASRPALGRPAATSSSKAIPQSTDAKKPVPEASHSVLAPNVVHGQTNVNKPTSSHLNVEGGKIQTSRPVRTTRNPAPQYVDEIRISPQQYCWSPSVRELAEFNKAIKASETNCTSLI